MKPFDIGDAGVFIKRYRTYIRHYTRDHKEIKERLAAWYEKWKNAFDAEIGELLFTRPTDNAVRQQSERIVDIVDVRDDHYIKRRSAPGSKHGLQVSMAILYSIFTVICL